MKTIAEYDFLKIFKVNVVISRRIVCKIKNKEVEFCIDRNQILIKYSCLFNKLKERMVGNGRKKINSDC